MVWRVRHRELREERAVKLIHPHVARDEVSLERLRREAQAMARVRHPHAVAVYDVCMDEVPYIEMEYLPGRSLNKVLKPKFPCRSNRSPRSSNSSATHSSTPTINRSSTAISSHRICCWSTGVPARRLT